MKCCVILPHAKIGGGIRVMLNYAHHLCRNNHEVTVLVHETRRFRRIEHNFFARRIPWFPDLDTDIKLCWMNHAQMVAFIEKYNHDAVIADSWENAKLLLSANAIERKYQIIQHDERLYHGNPQEVTEVYADHSLKKIVVSTWLKEMVEHEFNQDAFLALNSYEKDIFEPIPDAKADDEFLRILILDHSYEWKGTQEAVEIVQNLKKKYPHIKLMGYGARRADAGELYDEYYYQKVNREVAEIHSRADIFLCASWDEGFGLPSLEAMACGTAVVTYDNGGSRDFADDGITAMVASRRDKKELQDKLEKLICDVALRKKIATGGRKLALSWPTWHDQSVKLAQYLCQK